MSDMSRAHCSYPGCQQAHDNWPGLGLTEKLCQDHWESYCARQWWQACKVIDEAGLMIWPHMQTLELKS